MHKQQLQENAIYKQEKQTMKLNEWKETELFDMLLEKFVPGKKDKKDPKTKGKYSSDEELAAMEPPEDKVTQADVLAARGVLKDEDDDTTEETKEE